MLPRTFWPRLLLGLQAPDVWPYRVRAALIRRAGATLGRGATFQPGTSIVLGSLTVGRGVFVNRDCLFEASAGIEIGEDTAIAPRVSILTLSHDIDTGYPRAGTLRQEGVRIGRGVWIGASATILPGAIIGDGCVIAAGSLVRGHCAPDGLYAGVPARRIRDLPRPTRASSS